MKLVWPSSEYLAGYAAALETGWSPDNTRPQVAQEHLAAIAKDPAAFLASLVDKEAKGPPITLPDGSTVKRLPGFHMWMWDGEFCGDVGFRWRPGTTDLPPHCLGHAGYSVVPWKRRKGYATRALALLLPEARATGLPFIEVTTDAENVASQRVIEANGGVLFERFSKPAAYGCCAQGLRYRITL